MCTCKGCYFKTSKNLYLLAIAVRMANDAPSISFTDVFLWAETGACFHIPDRGQEGESHMRAICSLSSSEGHWPAMLNIQAPTPPPMLVLGIDLHLLMLSVRDGARS